MTLAAADNAVTGDDADTDAVAGAADATQAATTAQAGLFAKAAVAGKTTAKAGDPTQASSSDTSAAEPSGAAPTALTSAVAALGRQLGQDGSNGSGGKPADDPSTGLPQATASPDSASTQPTVAIATATGAASDVSATTAATATGGAAIVSQIADQIAAKTAGKSTRFDVSLDPAGLGRVDVQVHIDAAGQVCASLSFTNAQSAADARSHAADLQQALEQAGFNVPQGALSFDVGGHGAGFAHQQQAQGQASPGRRGRLRQHQSRLRRPALSRLSRLVRRVRPRHYDLGKRQMSTSGVGTTTSAAAAQNTLNSGLSSLANNYTSFLQLLTTQLKNQDPTSPMDTGQFTQQITEMTGVQQQLLSNQLLQQLVNQSQGGVTNAVDLIGKTVTANGSTSMLQNYRATFAYNLPSKWAKVTATITDSNNAVVWTGQLTGTGAGPQSFTWNGENSAGQGQTNGNLYTLSVAATNLAGQAVTPSSTVTGTVSAVQQVNGQTLITVGSEQVPLSSVTGVSG